MRYLFLAYRPWALKIINKLKKKFVSKNINIISSKNIFYKNIKKFNKRNTIIILVGWSDLLKNKIVDEFQCFGVHPSDLPSFRGGSPLQNQILNNIKKSKISLFKLNHKIDSGDVYLKTNLSLEGDNMSEIFKKLENRGYVLLIKFLKKYPKINPIKTKAKISYFKRRTKNESKIAVNDFEKKGLEHIYNKIRCLTYPYPNAYLEDKKGNKLYFESVKFKKK